MAMIINTNIASLNAQRNLTTTQSDLSVSLQRLSTGLRINSARDDAAGLAISERFSTQIRGLNQAARNANDGISLAQTAEGAMTEVTNNLQRIRELAVQARNATNSDSDRQALDAEVQQRINEINRVANQTEFNGLRILDGSFTEQVFQVGANYGQTISVSSIASTTSAALGLTGGELTTAEATVTGGVVTGDLTNGALTVNGTNLGVVAGSASAIALAINTLVSGVTAEANPTTVATGAVSAPAAIAGNVTDFITINGITLGAIALGGSNDAQATNVRAAINAVTAQTGVVATGTGANVGLEAADGRNIVVTLGGTAVTASTGLTAGTTRSTVTLTSESDIVIAGTNPALAGFTADTTAAVEITEVYGPINVLTATSADVVLRVIDDALTAVNGSRADLGAVQNRFESVIASLSSAAENMTSARSRILDADFAAETAALTRAQILQQAGVAILAQANALPQLALSLLQ